MEIPAKGTKKLKVSARSLLRAAEMEILQGAAQAAGFSDAADFKRSLIEALEHSSHFDQAAREFHSPLWPALSTGQRQKPGQHSVREKPAHVGGRVQAAHYDPSRGQHDRLRGLRPKGMGGRVRLGQKRASRAPGSSGRKG